MVANEIDPKSLTDNFFFNIGNKLTLIWIEQQTQGAQWLSLETEGMQVRASSASMCCVLEQDTSILA